MAAYRHTIPWTGSAIAWTWTGTQPVRMDSIRISDVPYAPTAGSQSVVLAWAADSSLDAADKIDVKRPQAVCWWIGEGSAAGKFDLGIRLLEPLPDPKHRLTATVNGTAVAITFQSGTFASLTGAVAATWHLPTASQGAVWAARTLSVQGLVSIAMAAYWGSYAPTLGYADADDLVDHLQTASLDILHGQPVANQRQGRIQPSVLKATAYNDDARFAAGNAQSPYNAGTKAIGEKYFRFGISDIQPLPVPSADKWDAHLRTVFSGRLEIPAPYSRFTSKGLRAFARLEGYGILSRALGEEREISPGAVVTGPYVKSLMEHVGLNSPAESVVGDAGWTRTYAVGFPNATQQFIPALASAADVEIGELADQDPGVVGKYNRLTLIPRTRFASATPVEATFIDRAPIASDTIEGWVARVQNAENVVGERLQHSDFTAQVATGTTSRFPSSPTSPWPLMWQYGIFKTSSTLAAPPATRGGWPSVAGGWGTQILYQAGSTNPAAYTELISLSAYSFKSMTRVPGALDGVSRVDWTGAGTVCVICYQAFNYFRQPSTNTYWIRVYLRPALSMSTSGTTTFSSSYTLNQCKVRGTNSDWSNPMAQLGRGDSYGSGYSYERMVNWVGLYVNPKILDVTGNLTTSTTQDASVYRNIGRRPFPLTPIFTSTTAATAWLADAKRRWGTHHKRLQFRFRPRSGLELMRLAGLARGMKVRVDLGKASGESWRGHMFIQSVNLTQRLGNVWEVLVDGLDVAAYYDLSP